MTRKVHHSQGLLHISEAIRNKLMLARLPICKLKRIKNKGIIGIINVEM